MAVVQRSLYRALLRPIARIRRSSQPWVMLWPQVTAEHWGNFQYGSAESTKASSLDLLEPSLLSPRLSSALGSIGFENLDASLVLNSSSLQSIVRQAFRVGAA